MHKHGTLNKNNFHVFNINNATYDKGLYYSSIKSSIKARQHWKCSNHFSRSNIEREGTFLLENQLKQLLLVFKMLKSLVAKVILNSQS